jgi:hypothetical protein
VDNAVHGGVLYLVQQAWQLVAPNSLFSEKKGESPETHYNQYHTP